MTGEPTQRLRPRAGQRGARFRANGPALAGMAALAACLPATAGAAGDGRIPTPEEQLAAFTVADGFEVNLYASESDGPLFNPTAMAFDARGRLWVTTAPGFPQYLPGHTPEDKVLVFEDTNRDGRADGHTVFADHLLMPTGLAVDVGGLWLAQQPNLWHLRDTDGDGVADRRRVVAQGFGTEDCHHAISAFTWGPDGALYFNEGIFLHSQVETPWGPQRLVDGGVDRFKVSSQRITVISHRAYFNPWGHAFDRWGRSILSDASDGKHYNFGAVIAPFEYPEKTVPADSLLFRGRPMAGNLIVSSRQFPEEFQGTHLNHQCVDFHGIRWDRLVEIDTGWAAQPLPDLLSSADPCFRPVAGAFGPDGALYVLDFCSPAIGHMTFTHRDPVRDHRHGRIWRITAKGRPLLEWPEIEGRPIPELLDLLTAHENHVRHFARRELQSRPAAGVLPEVAAWIDTLDGGHPEHERHLLEALWVCAGLDAPQRNLLDTLLDAADHRARASAVRQLRHWLQEDLMTPEEGLERLRDRVIDAHPAVRLEAVVACGCIPDAAAGEVALAAAGLPMDQNLEACLEQTLTVLERFGGAGDSAGRAFRLERLPAAEFAALPLDGMVARLRLTRSDMDAGPKREALDRLAALEPATTPTGHLVEALAKIDRSHGEVAGVDALLLGRPVDELRAAEADLLRMAREARHAAVRESALAAVTAVDGDLDRALATGDVETVLGGVRRLDDPRLLERLHPVVRAMTAPSREPAIRAAAIRTLPRFAAHHAETSTLAAALVASSDEAKAPEIVRFAAAEALASLPEEAVPVDLRTRFAPTDIVIHAVRGQLLYDRTNVSVHAGRPVRLTLRNPDAVPHNLVIVLPGMLDEVGEAAVAMLAAPGGGPSSLAFVPDHPAVLHATRLLTEGESETLRFFAPEEPGDYPFLCTFPGHFRLMHGTLTVEP